MTHGRDPVGREERDHRGESSSAASAPSEDEMGGFFVVKSSYIRPYLELGRDDLVSSK